MPDTETYTPAQLADETQILAENYLGAVSEIEDTREGIAQVQKTVDEINAKIVPVDLSNVTPFVLDFVNDPIIIISGGLDTYSRTISN